MVKNELIEKVWEVNQDRRMSWDELEWLYDRFESFTGNSLEIGAYRGMLTYMCSYFAKLHGSAHTVVDVFDIPIDIDEENTHHYGEHTEELMIKSLGEYAESTRLVKSKSLDWLGSDIIVNGEYDYCFIDGDHRDPTVYLELCLCKHSVKHILGHDYGWPGVTKSVDRFCKENGLKVFQPLGGRGVFELLKA